MFSITHQGVATQAKADYLHLCQKGVTCACLAVDNSDELKQGWVLLFKFLSL